MGLEAATTAAHVRRARTVPASEEATARRAAAKGSHFAGAGAAGGAALYGRLECVGGSVGGVGPVAAVGGVGGVGEAGGGVRPVGGVGAVGGPRGEQVTHLHINEQILAAHKLRIKKARRLAI